MRLTPAQVGMSLMIRGSLPMMRYSSRAEGMARGLQYLRRASRTDFGYDLRAWHDHLIETDAGGYKWSNKHRSYPKQIETALLDPEWLAAAHEAEASNLCNELTARDKRQRDVQYAAEREWSGKPRVCPKCETEFTSVQNKGQCTTCGFMFYASHPDSGNEMWWLTLG